MIDTLKVFFKSLNKKEKIIVISSMSAFAVVLIAVVLLISFCGAVKHNHKYDYIMEMQDGKFNVIGKCFGEEGECNKPDVFIADVKATASTTKNPTCIAEGETVYTYTHDNKELTYTVSTPVVDHRVNGTLAGELANADGSFNYNVPGVYILTDDDVCEGTVSGYYTCEDCNGVVSIQVYKPHIAVERPGIPATCTTTGTRKIVCDDCGIALDNDITVPALGHDYSYTLTIDSGSASELSYKCLRDDCHESKTEAVTSYSVTGSTVGSCAAPAKTVYKVTTASGKTYENIVVDSKERIPHKLNGKDAKDTYEYGTPGIQYFADSNIICGTTFPAYFICDVCKNIEGNDGMVNVQVAKPDHVYYLDYSTLVKPDYKTAGVIYYRCTNIDCTLKLEIKLPKVIVSGAGKNADIISPATEDHGEIAKYKFTNELPFDVTVEIDEVISAPAIGHNYTYSLVGDGVAVGAEIKGTCSNSGCSKPETKNRISQIVKSVITKATCVSPAGSSYELILDNGQKITLEISSGTTLGDHQLAGVDGSSLQNYDGTYYDNIKGIKIFGNGPLDCDATENGYYQCEACGGLVSVTVKGAHSWNVEVVTAPTLTAAGTATLTCADCDYVDTLVLNKIVLDGANKNAKKLSESSAAIVYEYTVDISIDDSLVIKITVPKA